MRGMKERKITGYVQQSESFGLALLLTLAGGFLDTYTYICRDRVFANAQTGNIACLAICLAQQEWLKAVRYMIPIVSFVLGVTLAIHMRAWFKKTQSLHWRQAVVLLEAALLLVVSFIPTGNIGNMIANVIVSFTCAIQVETFRKFNGNAFASTMCTGNLRSATEKMNEYFRNRSPEAKQKSAWYFGIDVMFLIGAVLGAIFTKWLGIRAVWLCCAMLLGAFCVMIPRPEEAPDDI